MVVHPILSARCTTTPKAACWIVFVCGLPLGLYLARYTAEDHTALAASGILEAVSAVLTASHVKRQLVQARSELLSGGGVSEAEADVIVRAATEKALYSPWCGARLPLPRKR